MINLFGHCREEAKIEELYRFSHVVAWNLRQAFTKLGVESRFIDVRFIDEIEKEIPEADHSIVISSRAAKAIRSIPEIHEKVRQATRGKLTFYLDSDYEGWLNLFDYILTVVPPIREDPRYVYAGWGADTNLFYPEQEEKAAFIDALMYGYYKNKFNHYYDIIKKVFNIPKENLLTGDSLEYDTTINGKAIKVYMPSPIYRKRSLPWPTIQKILRKCHYHLCTELGESGLTRIESATCGGLLVVPRDLYRKRTMAPLEHSIWETERELIDIIMTETDPKTIKEKALKQTWEKAATRILKCLER